jgi:Phage major capsid protein E
MPTAELPQLRNDVFALPTPKLIELFNELPSPPAFFRDTFFGRELLWPTIEIEVSYRRGSQSLSPLVMEYQIARTLLRPPMQLKRITLPMFSPARALHPSDVLLGLTPQHFFQGLNPNDFAAALIVRDREEIEHSLALTEEFSCASLLCTNEIHFKTDGGGEVALIFEGNELIVLPADQRFDNDAASPIETLTDQARALAQKCGFRPTHCILGSAAARAFLRNPAVVKERQMMSHTAFPEIQELPDSVSFLGIFAGLRVLEYNGIFAAADGTITDLMPANLCVLVNRNQPGTMNFGAIGQVENRELRFYSAPRVPLIWSPEGSDVYHFRIASRFCPIPADSQGFQSLHVVGEPPPVQAAPDNGNGETHGQAPSEPAAAPPKKTPPPATR